MKIIAQMNIHSKSYANQLYFMFFFVIDYKKHNLNYF